MRTDSEIRAEGLRALMTALGDVEAERFIALLNRERFDYTEWRKNQWDSQSVSDLAAQARALRQAK